MIKFWAPWLSYFVFWQILSWSFWRLNQALCEATVKLNTLSYDNSYSSNIQFLILTIFSHKCKSQNDFSRDFHEIMHWEHHKNSGSFAGRENCGRQKFLQFSHTFILQKLLLQNLPGCRIYFPSSWRADCALQALLCKIWTINILIQIQLIFAAFARWIK